MFALSKATRVFLLPGPTDMRKGFNGLYDLARHQLDQDPESGHLFVFCNRSCNRIKVLFWDGSGLWVCAKRLEAGRFSWPRASSPSAGLSMSELGALLDGIELEKVRRKKWYRQ